MNKINWDEHCKIRLALADESMDKHDIIKMQIVRSLRRKYKKDLGYVRIYTEHCIRKKGNERFCDVYFENIKTKEVYCFEIQKEINPKWLNETTEFYKDLDKELFFSCQNFKTVDLIVIPIRELSDNIPELTKQLDKYIV